MQLQPQFCQWPKYEIWNIFCNFQAKTHTIQTAHSLLQIFELKIWHVENLSQNHTSIVIFEKESFQVIVFLHKTNDVNHVWS